MITAPSSSRTSEQGTVLIIALMVLMVLSLITATSIRATSSTELSSNNTRTQALAMQAAEAALRACESGVLNTMNLSTTTVNITPTAAPVGTATYTYESLANWDGSGTGANVVILNLSLINNTSGGLTALYKRPPECMAQYMQTGSTQRTIITARGFGPEVPDVTSARLAPAGSEVWLQSTLSR